MSVASMQLATMLAGQTRVGNPGSPYGLGAAMGFGDAAADMWAQQAGEGEAVAPVPGLPSPTVPMTLTPAPTPAPTPAAVPAPAPVVAQSVGLFDQAKETWGSFHPGLQGVAPGAVFFGLLRLLRR